MPRPSQKPTPARIRSSLPVLARPIALPPIPLHRSMSFLLPSLTTPPTMTLATCCVCRFRHSTSAPSRSPMRRPWSARSTCVVFRRTTRSCSLTASACTAQPSSRSLAAASTTGPRAQISPSSPRSRSSSSKCCVMAHRRNTGPTLLPACSTSSSRTRPTAERFPRNGARPTKVTATSIRSPAISASRLAIRASSTCQANMAKPTRPCVRFSATTPPP